MRARVAAQLFYKERYIIVSKSMPVKKSPVWTTMADLLFKKRNVAWRRQFRRLTKIFTLAFKFRAKYFHINWSCLSLNVLKANLQNSIFYAHSWKHRFKQTFAMACSFISMWEAQFIVDLVLSRIWPNLHIYKGLYGKRNRTENCKKITAEF